MHRITFAVLALLAALFVGCGGEVTPTDTDTHADGQQAAAQDEQPELDGQRSQLIQQLVQRGDAALASGNSVSAHKAYEFAVKYAPDNADIKAKLKSTSKPDARDPAGLIKAALRFTQIVKRSHSASLSQWAPRTGVSTDIAELTLLLTDDLVGDLGSGSGTFTQGASGTLNCFLHEPNMKLADIRALLGAPTDETHHEGGGVSLTYGRFRINVDDKGNAVGVLFLPD